MATKALATFDSKLAETGYRPSGFDYMRLILSMLIVAVHSFNVTGHEFSYTAWHGPFRPLLALILPMFFCLSGFLVAGSFVRCRTIISFGGLRVLRLVPALLVDTLIGALILGPIFTTLPLHDYFSNHEFFTYFQNIFGHVHFRLPGVFLHNPDPGNVNLQLWTLPFELKCYLSLMLLSFIGVAQRPRAFLPLIIVLNIAALAFAAGARAEELDTVVPGHVLVLCFLFGIAAFLFKERIVWSRSLMLLSLLMVLTFMSLPNLGDYLVPIPATYLTVYLGLLQPRRSIAVTSGDYSYGIFLYGYPVQQAVITLCGGAQHWYTNLAISLPVTILFAAGSWHLVEKPTLKLRKALLKIEDYGMHLSTVRPWTRFLLPVLRKP